jgi:formamidopyrimidine-DNA glycosylase
MLEIPESTTLARQLNETVRGKTIRRAVANASPHKFTFYKGDPAEYGSLLSGKVIGSSYGFGAIVEISAGDKSITVDDGANLRYYPLYEAAPDKHQLYLEFDDSSALVCTIQMYGGIAVFTAGESDSKFYLGSKERPQPLTDAFDRAYFNSLFGDGWEKLSAKAFLATEQRIPGLGNGVLQDILFNAGINPKTKMGKLSASGIDKMYDSVKNTLSEMTRLGGRDIEKDLFGNPGGYKTILSKNTLGKPCPKCGTIIEKTAYMGGAVYWCPGCQPLE